MRSLFRFFAAVGLLAVVSSCAPPPPYVYIEKEFDRDREDFGQDPTDITSVTICYNKRGTTPDAVVAMAAEQCARFGKQARFAGQDYDTCPLATPAAAHFDCVAPDAGATDSIYPYQ